MAKENGCECVNAQFAKSVLTNVAYIGDLLLQQHYSPKVHIMKKNNGEMPKYRVNKHHPAIIYVEVFEMVQQKMEVKLHYNT